jgi:hypothetical protein
LSESTTHMSLVRAIVVWINTHSEFSAHAAVLVSSPESTADNLPPSINGRIPDVFSHHSAINSVLIGEAKTAGDIESYRSREQFADYLRFLSEQKQSHLVVAVPWYCVNQARSLLKAIQRTTKTYQVRITVLDKLPG